MALRLVLMLAGAAIIYLGLDLGLGGRRCGDQGEDGEEAGDPEAHGRRAYVGSSGRVVRSR